MNDAKNEMQTSTENFPATSRDIGAFANLDNFQDAQRMAQALVSSSLVPADYRGKENLGNAVIALSMAQRIGADPMMVMQNLYVVHGKPAWSAQFVISAINSCGRFSPLRFDLEGDGDSRTCVAWVREKGSGDRLEGPPVSMVMAKAEGWVQKNGSKWKTMPEVMLRYRAASFFGRMYAPDILMGMQTQEEIRDVYDAAPVDVVDRETGEVVRSYETKTAGVAEKVAQAAQDAQGNADGGDPMVTAAEWPQQITDESTGELRWADSAGHFYDQDQHGMSADRKTPSVTKRGVFRRRRGDQGTRVSADPVSTPPAGTGQQQDQPAEDAAAPVVTADELAERVQAAQSTEELDDIFRARRGAGGRKASAGPGPTAGPGPREQQAQPAVDAAAPVVTADELAERVQATQDAAELDEIEDLARSLADPAEQNAVRAIIEQRRGVL